MSMKEAGGPVRAATLASFVTLLTALGHQAGGGALPDLALVVALLPLLAGVLVSAARRCTSLPGVVLTLGAGQVVLHYLLEALHPHADGPALLGTSGMAVMHALATLATAVAVRHADVAVAAVRAALRRVVPHRLAPPPVAVPMVALAVPAPAVPARLACACSAPVVRRGPPAGR